MKEEWKEIRGFSRYDVSNQGRVRTRSTGHVHKGALDMGGYRKLCLRDDKGKARSVAEHRLVSLAYIPNPLNKPQVNHKDFIADNNHVENLEWVTGQENHDHKMRAGRNASPGEELHGMAKLSKREVREIYDLSINKTFLQRDIAKLYGISKHTVKAIKYKLNWKKFTDKLDEGVVSL